MYAPSFVKAVLSANTFLISGLKYSTWNQVFTPKKYDFLGNWKQSIDLLIVLLVPLRAFGDKKSFNEYKTAYNLAYWEKLNIPPNTRFFNKNIGELVDLFGVPLENQFKYSNMR